MATATVVRPTLSLAGAAKELQCEVWAVRLFCRQGLLNPVVIDGHPRIRHIELRAFRDINRDRSSVDRERWRR